MTERLSRYISNAPLADTDPQSVGYWSKRRAWVVRGRKAVGGIHLLRYSDFTNGHSACGLRPDSWACVSLSGAQDSLCGVCAVLVEMEQE